MRRSTILSLSLKLLLLAGPHEEIPGTNTTAYFVNASKWLIILIVGQSPQNSSVSEAEVNNLDYASKMKIGRYKRRLQMLMRALYIISGTKTLNIL
jgi:hypothetical protein